MELTARSFVEACREGGRRIEAWLRIVDREHAAPLYREAAALLGNWAAAEDAVQDGMVKVWQRCATFRGEAEPLAWIRQIVRHTVLDRLRQQRPEQPLYDDEGELTPAAAVAVQRAAAGLPTPESQLTEQQLEQVFRRGFDAFAADWPDHAAVLRWVVEDGLDNTEIEVLLGRSPGATREYVSQCRKKARPYLAEWYALVNPKASEARGTR